MGPRATVKCAARELLRSLSELRTKPTLRNADYGLRFHVVVENVSAADVYVWAEGNSEGHGTLSFEVTEAGGKKWVVKRTPREWSKNIIRLEKLAPGGYHVRAVEYDPFPGKAREWEPFPFGPKDSRVEVTMRAVFEQPKADWRGKLTPWAGRVEAPALKVVLMNA